MSDTVTGGSAVHGESAPGAATHRIFPSSYAQRRLWFLDQMGPGNAAYNIYTALRLRGVLDIGALRRALVDVVARHDALRTTFTVIDGEPYQNVAHTIPVALPLTEPIGVPAPERAANARVTLERETAQAFDLARGPLLKTKILRLDETDHVLSVICHHTVCDGWSMDLLLTELAARYSAYRADGVLDLSPPPQFGEQAIRQREEMAGGPVEQALSHWREALKDGPSLLELPTSYTRPAVQGFDGATVVSLLDPSRWEAVRTLAKSHRVTPFMVLLSAYAVLLSRLSGARDLVIGAPSAGRTEAAQEPVIGMFVNTLPLRVRLMDDPAFGALMRRVRRTVLGAQTHQSVPLDRIVTELALDRATSHDPVFQTMFALQPPVEAPGFDGLATEIFPVAPSTTLSDLWLEVRPSEGGAECAFHYRTELFDEEAVERMARQYRRVVDTALAAPDTRLSRFGLLEREEAGLILDEWSRSPLDLPWQAPVHEAIARQAARTPDATAVVSGGDRLTYARLIALAGALAHRLTADGARPEPVVALCLERGLELPVSVVGVLSAGRAYLPLSPDDPPARLAELLRSSGAGQILATRATLPALAGTDLPVVLVDNLLDEVRGQAEGPAVTVTVRPDDLAYAMYTSGSTGRPKAVGVPQRGLANRIACLQRTQPLTAMDRVLHKTPYTFDVSVWELIWPLTAGATLVLAAPGGHRDPAYLVELIRRENVTTAHFVPPMLEAFLGEPDLDRCRSLRRVICSGQALPAALRDRCLSALPWARLFNFYGPTEASIEVTEWECRPAAPGTPEHTQVPIGRPIAGVETYVLDDELQLVPPGVTGELYLGGVALARGYLGRPALTADHFVPHPYAERAGSRLYRTGDLVRWRTDGVLEYLGRGDHQLKVRGFRIEPGEIENAIRAHPAVRDAVVTADRSGLIAYVVPQAQGDPETEPAVRDLIQGRLPEYMVPSRFVMLPRLPLSANGKVDRSALPAPTEPGTAGETAPRNEEERILAGIWSRVLGGSAVGITDDFFAFGGDSLKSIQVVHRAREAGLSLTVGDVFRHPTVGRLAAYLRHRDGSSTNSGATRER